MWTRDEIRTAIAHLGIDAIEVSADATKAALESLGRAFAKPGSAPLWERLRNGVGFHDPDAWRRIAELEAAPALLLVEDSQGECGFRFANVADIEPVLADCFGFEFYVTNEKQTYLLALNHHDVLIGAGDAAEWIERLKDGKSTSREQ